MNLVDKVSIVWCLQKQFIYSFLIMSNKLTKRFSIIVTNPETVERTVVTFHVKSCYILRQKLLHFELMLHFTSKVVTFRVNVTFCVNCYILRRNIISYFLPELP